MLLVSLVTELLRAFEERALEELGSSHATEPLLTLL